MTLRAIPRPKDQAWRYDWASLRCDVCWAEKFVPVQLVAQFGLPGCAQCERRERWGH